MSTDAALTAPATENAAPAAPAPVKKPRAPRKPKAAPATPPPYAAYVDKTPTLKQEEFTAWLIKNLGINPASLTPDAAFELATRTTVVLYGKWQAENRAAKAAQ